MKAVKGQRAAPTPPTGRAPSPARIDAAHRSLADMGVAVVISESTTIELRRERVR